MMAEIKDGYYFMFEIGWFIDLLIPTLVRVKDDIICLVGSKPCDTKGIKPCCLPCGDELEVKKLSMDDPVIKGFKCIYSLILIDDYNNLNVELEKNLSKNLSFFPLVLGFLLIAILPKINRINGFLEPFHTRRPLLFSADAPYPCTWGRNGRW